uniref:Importin N-terminal domain-containing protein n=1 Tax=Naja naja TaxID=35670 RepID=A0A8C6XLZ6_NAJNA
MELVTILEKTVSPDCTELEAAQKFLEQAAIENLPTFLVELSRVLANPGNSQVARVAAGLQIKNSLTSKDPDVKTQHQQRWLAIDANARREVKNYVLQTLGTETYRPSSASQCVAGIACAEIPMNQWPELIPQLVANVTNQHSTEHMKESTLEAIGYICQDIDPEQLQDKSNEILTAIIQGMRKEEPSNNVKLAATNALLNSLEFTKANFDKEVSGHIFGAMPTLIELMKDPSVVVRDTTAWTVGRICELLPEAAINDIYLAPLLQCLIEGLSAEPRVASNVCWAFSGLAEAAYEAADVADDQEPATYCLSSSFELIVQKLLETTDRPDGHQNNLRSAAYEALMEIVKNSAEDCYPAVQKTTLVIMERLQQVLQMESHIQSTSDRIQFNDLQSLLCATLQNVLRKVQHHDALQISDVVMASLLRMFQSTAGSGGVQEDALMAVSTLVEVLGGEFLKYMDAFKPFLSIGLKNYAEYQVCLAAVGLVGDLCRALQSNILPFCDEVMQLLLENLGNENVHQSVKPQILSVFGDIALAIGGEFKKYLEVVLNTLHQASQTQIEKSDYDMVEYLNELRETCLEAYTGIIQGLKGDQENVHPDVMLVQPRVEFILSFIDHIAADEDHSDGVVACAAGLIGDLCTAFGKDVLKMVEARPMIHELLTEGRRSTVNKTKTLATWATKELRKLKNQAW